mgnify:CR=1 FL=1
MNADGSFNSNSYNSGDEVNGIRWSNLEQEEYRQVVDYYKGLIAFRKEHGVLRLDDAQAVKEHVRKADDVPDNVLAFNLTGGDCSSGSNPPGKHLHGTSEACQTW